MKNSSNRSSDFLAALRLALVLAAALLALPARAEVQVLDRIAAIVDDDVVMDSDVAARMKDIKAQITARGASQPPDDVLRKQVLDRLILESIQVQLGTRMGVRVDDDTLNAALASIAKQNNLSLHDFIDQLQKEGMDYATFRENVRRDMVINRLRQRRVGERVRVTDAEVDDFLKSAEGHDLFSSSYRLSNILVAVPETATVDQVKAAGDKAQKIVDQAKAGADFGDLAVRSSDAANALEGGDLGWRTAAQLPSAFAGITATMKKGDVIGPIRSGSGFNVVKVMDVKGDASHVVQQSKVRHVLIKTSAIRNDEEAKAFATQLHDRVAGGEDFAEVAKHFSEDYGSATQGGDLGWVSPGEMVEEFQAMVDATPVGGLSPVFQTQFGWHFLQVLDRRDQDTSEDYRRLQARNAVYKRKFDTELDNWLRELRNEAYVEIKGT